MRMGPAGSFAAAVADISRSRHIAASAGPIAFPYSHWRWLLPLEDRYAAIGSQRRDAASRVQLTSLNLDARPEFDVARIAPMLVTGGRRAGRPP